MGRASDAEKAERLNRARGLLRQFKHLPDAVERLAHDCSISPRQAYRYLQQAQRLKEPVAVAESKVAFTVKLPRSLIQRVRLYASVRKLSISEVVSRALLALVPRGRGRAGPQADQATHTSFGVSFRSFAGGEAGASLSGSGAGQAPADHKRRAHLCHAAFGDKTMNKQAAIYARVSSDR